MYAPHLPTYLPELFQQGSSSLDDRGHHLIIKQIIISSSHITLTLGFDGIGQTYIHT